MVARGGGAAGLLVALGVDNFGSGLFLPLILYFSTEVVGLPLGTAGAAVSLGSVVGLAVPALVAGVIDRVGARAVVVCSQLLQAIGTAAFLTAHGSAGVVVGALFVATGTQTFYSGLFTLVSGVTQGSTDRSFAHVEMVRAATFGVGALVSAAVLATGDVTALRVLVGIDTVSFLVAAVLLAATVPRVGAERTPSRAGNPWRDRPFVVLVLVTCATGLATDVFLAGNAVFTVQLLETPAWVPGICVALLTALSSTTASFVIGWTRGLRRTTTIALGAWLLVAWAVACAAALWLPPGWRGPWVLAATVVLAAASMLTGIRCVALAEASAPEGARGRYLATVQYGFTTAQLLAPLVVGLASVATWAPWGVVAGSSAAGALTLRWLARRLPAHAVSG